MTPFGDPANSAAIGELVDFFENAAIGLQSIGPDGEVLWANQALLDLLGFAKTEYVGHPIREFHADDHVVAEFMRRLTAGETLRDYEAPLRCKDGAIKHVLIDANVYREHGSFVHTRCFVRDVTERKRLEEQLAEHARKLAEADRCKDEFLANLSHELRTPLNVILGWSRLLQAGELDERQRVHAISTIERNVATQAKLIEDLLDVSRIISGKLTLEATPIALCQLVAPLIDAEAPMAKGKGVTLSFAHDAAEPIIIGDPHRLQQIVQNLVSNAIKFTGAKGHVEVAVEHDDKSVHLRVSDDGRGISPTFLPFVFDRFRQADGTSRRGSSGLGLGLAIVHDLVKLHGGFVTVKSAGEGCGASFTATFPLAALRLHRNANAPVAARPADAAAVALAGVSVLIVDDQPDTCELMTMILERTGARVVVANCVPDALAAIARERPDVVVSDIGLPGEDGYDLIRQLRALPSERGGNTPAAALTAYAHPEDRQRALRAGFDLHMGKPVTPADLIATVKVLSRLRVESQRASSPGTRRPCVLVVDDDPGLRDALRASLDDEGYEVLTAADGLEAIERLRLARAQLILLDVNMPRMNGHEFRKYQRTDPMLASIPTVLLTAVEPAPHELAPDAPVAVVRKPVQSKELFALVERLVAQGAGPLLRQP